MPQHIDLTPTWSALLPTILAVYDHNITKNNPRSIGTIRNLTSELARMAAAADKWNEYCTAVNTAAGIDEQEQVNEALAPPPPYPAQES